MKKLAAALVATGALAVVAASPASAVPLHQHTTTTSGALVALGFCKNPQLFAAGERLHHVFHNFHENVHLGPAPVTVLANCP
jgi:hypothetical protein